MKKRSYILVLVLILVIVVAAFVYHLSAILNDKKEIPHEGNYSSQEILNIIKPEIDNYCKTLNGNVVHSACPTCTSYINNKNESYVYVNNLSEDTSNVHSYIIKNDGNSYDVEMKLHLIYGRNDRPGSVLLKFKIDENGTIISKDLPIKGCI